MLISTAKLIEQVERIRSSGRRVFSNNYAPLGSMPDTDWAVTVSEQSVCIFLDEPGVCRVRFFTTDLSDLAAALSRETRELTFDIVTRVSGEHDDAFSRIGVSKLARMQRMCCSDVSVYLSDHTNSHVDPIKASIDDLPSIKATLWSIFDPRISHLQTDEEMERSIKAGEISILRENGCITSLLQAIVHPKRFYINQIYNSGPSEYIHSMLRKELASYCAHGGRHAYAWVQDSNIVSIRFHEKYGMKPDGLWTEIYVRPCLN